jgi:HTH-like domain
MSQAVQAIAETVAATPHGCSVALLCRAAGLSRASYYRHHFPLCASTALEMNTPRQVVRGQGEQRDMDQTTWHDAIQQIALEMPAYGYRRITQELHRRGMRINHKRVLL